MFRAEKRNEPDTLKPDLDYANVGSYAVTTTCDTGGALLGPARFDSPQNGELQTKNPGRGGAPYAGKKDNEIAREPVFRAERKQLSFDRPILRWCRTGLLFLCLFLRPYEPKRR